MRHGTIVHPGSRAQSSRSWPWYGVANKEQQAENENGYSQDEEDVVWQSM